MADTRNYEQELKDLESKYKSDVANVDKLLEQAGYDWNPSTKKDKAKGEAYKSQKKQLTDDYKKRKAALEVERDKAKMGIKTSDGTDGDAKKKAEDIKVVGTGYSAHGAATQKAKAVADPTAENVENAQTVAKNYKPNVSKADRDLNVVESGEVGKAEPKTPQEEVATVSETVNPNLEKLEETRKDIHDMNLESKMELEPELEKYNLQAESLIDPNYLENIPRNIWRDFARGDFGRKKIDEKVKAAYDKIKDIPEDKLTEEQKKDLALYNKQKRERKDAWSTFGSLLLNQLATGLSNAGVAAQGGVGTKKSKYEQIQQSKLAGGLERYNKKYSDMANMDTELLNSSYRNDRDIDNQLKKVYADKSVQPYLTKLDLDTRRVFVNYVAAMGKEIDFKQLPGLLMGLMMYQDTGKIPGSAMNMLGQAGSGVMGLVKALL